MWRRVRGLLGTALTWGVAGTAIAAAMFLWNYRAWPIDAVHWKRSLTILGAFLGGGALWGSASGLAFGLVLLSAERRRRLQHLSARRITIWGAVAGATFPVLLYTPIVLQGARDVLPLYALIAGLSAIAGALCGRLSFALAQRALKSESRAASLAVPASDLQPDAPFVGREHEPAPR